MAEGHAAIGISLRVEAWDVCPKHGKVHTLQDECQMGLIGISDHPLSDISVKALAQGLLLNLFMTNQSIIDVTSAINPEVANTAITAVNIHAGSGLTTPAFPDYQIQGPLTNTGNTAYVTGTTHGISGTSFTITGTLVNSSGGNLTYGNIGIEITLSDGHVYLLTHDIINAGVGYLVGPNGNVIVTYTFNFT